MKRSFFVGDRVIQPGISSLVSMQVGDVAGHLEGSLGSCFLTRCGPGKCRLEEEERKKEWKLGEEERDGPPRL